MTVAGQVGRPEPETLLEPIEETTRLGRILRRRLVLSFLGPASQSATRKLGLAEQTEPDSLRALVDAFSQADATFADRSDELVAELTQRYLGSGY